MKTASFLKIHRKEAIIKIGMLYVLTYQFAMSEKNFILTRRTSSSE